MASETKKPALWRADAASCLVALAGHIAGPPCPEIGRLVRASVPALDVVRIMAPASTRVNQSRGAQILAQAIDLPDQFTEITPLCDGVLGIEPML